jgi:hypothetical protein
MLDRVYTTRGDHTVNKSDIADRDILSTLIRANMAEDIPDAQRLTDDDVIAREQQSRLEDDIT